MPTREVRLLMLVMDGAVGGAKALTVRSKAWTSWLLVSPPVAPVKPNHAVDPTSAGRSMFVIVRIGEPGLVVVDDWSR